MSASKPYKNKQELREDLERRTDPTQSPEELMSAVAESAMLGGCLALRSAIAVLKDYTDENDDFPCEEHKEITHRVMAGMRERMVAFETEIINAFVDLAWEVHECECDFCAKKAAEMEVVDRVRKAPFN